MNGIVNVYKEKGYTSHDVVAILRGVLRTKKIGHTGTLDPDAEGVLPVCVGSATKIANDIMGSSKRYTAVLCFGSETTTQDASGDVVKTYEYQMDKEAVKRVCESFVGEIDQVPPMYSALKVDGMKLYELARMGETVERKARKITIHELNLLDVTDTEATIDVVCSKGTYIRTLCEDIGKALGYGAHMKSLLRTATGNFYLKDSHKIDEIRELMNAGKEAEFFTPLEHFYEANPGKTTPPEDDKYLHNGNNLTYPMDSFENTGRVRRKDIVRMYDSEHVFIGLYEVLYLQNDMAHMKVYKMF